MKSYLLCFIALLMNSISDGFLAPSPKSFSRETSHLGIFNTKPKSAGTGPKFNKATERWEPPVGYDEMETYGPVGSLLRQGPGPFITRLTQSDQYEQAVLKYMASEPGMSRVEAQANMDAFFNNAADWSYQKMEEKRGAPKVDYNKIKTKDVALALIWAVFITPFLVRSAYLIAVTGNWDISLDQILTF